ncbi:MAG: C25 family cysteine peptidase, partial [bacterium]
TPNGSQVRTIPFANLITSEPRQYRYTIVGASSNGASFNVYESGTLIGTHYLYPSGGYSLATEGTFGASGNFPLTNNNSTLRFEFVSNEAGASGWLDWAEVVYQRTFDPVNNSLRFRSPDTTGVVEYRLGQFSATSSVFNVTGYADVKRVGATAGTFRANEIGGRVSEYFGLTTSAYKAPIGVARIDNQNLRGIDQPYDYIIITSPEFASAANRLKTHRSAATWYGGMKPVVVDVNQIYNEFSSGVPDVSAIRDFLKYAYENWATPPQSPPKFVCFFGQGSYDYKGITGSRSSYVPTWEGREEYNDVSSTATDDFFVKFDPGSRPWMVSGRLNVRNSREAEQEVDKLIAYDTQSEHDQWKLRSVYVGDDSWTPDFDEGSEHTRGAEEVAARTPDIFEKRKIYLEEYPVVQTAQGRRKPAAYQDIIDAINRGALLVSFTGHGNPTVWTHEAVFTTQTSIAQLFNKNKLFVFFGATCNFTQFDDLNRPSGGELLLSRVEGGAIGVISASRKVYSAENHRLNNGIFENLFPPGPRISAERVATALYQYKQGSNDANDEKYFWLGDPTMRLQYPRGYASIDSINTQPVDSIGGVARLSPIQMKALQKVTVKGTIRNAANQVQTSFNGRSTLTVNDGNRNISIPSFGTFTYVAPGGLLYRGENSVS